jgi:hypothetical protein
MENVLPHPQALPAGAGSRLRRVKAERSSTAPSAFLQVTCSLHTAQHSTAQHNIQRVWKGMLHTIVVV